MTPLERFTALLEERKAAPEFTARAAIVDEYNAELRRLWDARTPKPKKAFAVNDAETWLGDRVKEIAAPYVERAKAAAEAAGKRRKLIAEELAELAPQIDLTPSEDVWSVYATSSPYTYGSQTSPGTYAAASAEIHRREAAQYLPPELVRVERVKGDDDIRVIVPLDAVRVEALKLLPGLGMRDFLKAAWSIGANPRVLIPGLPHGLEEKFGVDYQGRDLPPK